LSKEQAQMHLDRKKRCSLKPRERDKKKQEVHNSTDEEETKKKCCLLLYIYPLLFDE
jgi:hypothetical protein